MSGFRGSKIVSPYLVLVFMTPTKVKLNKPLQIGATILEHSKVSLLFFFAYDIHAITVQRPEIDVVISVHVS